MGAHRDFEDALHLYSMFVETLCTDRLEHWIQVLRRIMIDSELRDAVAARREARVRQIKRWVAYIKSNPPDVWGPLQNALVDSQLESA